MKRDKGYDPYNSAATPRTRHDARSEQTANHQIALYAAALRQLPKWEPVLDTRENWGTPDRYRK